jgi:hypothetical protein
MGWQYRKSLSLGPFRLNLSKSGVGYSVGGRGFRTGVNARGRRYSRVTIPGTGVSYHESHGPRAAGGKGCLVLVIVALACLMGLAII